MPADAVSINLLGRSDLAHSPIGRILTWATTYGRYIMIGTEIIVLLAFISRFSLDRRLTDLREEIAQKQAILEANVLFERDIRSLEERLAKITSLIADQPKSVQLATLMETILPTDVYLQSLDISKDKLSLSAVAGSTDGFSQFLANLQSEEQIKDIEVHDVKKRPVQGIEFTLIAHLGTSREKR